jgi:hypothetical protein
MPNVLEPLNAGVFQTKSKSQADQRECKSRFPQKFNTLKNQK